VRIEPRLIAQYFRFRLCLHLYTLFLSLTLPRPPVSTLFPYTTLFRSRRSRQRRYTEAVFGRISLIRLALEAGFTIGETRLERERSEEHTSELQSLAYLVCRLLLEKKKQSRSQIIILMTR